MGIVVISANAGGAWSPIGDVTTTMLWIGGQISSLEIIKAIIFPSLICMLAPLIYLSFRMKGVISRPPKSASRADVALPVRQQTIVFFTGLLVLIFVPIFKTVTHLPPYLGILFGLGILWIVTEVIHGNKDEEDKHQLSVAYALRKIDTPSILFFFGILVSIASLESAGILQTLSFQLTQSVESTAAIGLLMGLLSAIIDNVPLVAAVQAMFSLDVFPQDHAFWHFLAYTTGTGGSLLIIGSAAGVAAMGLEKISFFWYLKAMSLLALLGYFSGAIFFLLQHNLR
jgi:Na+/H+ antiporter NhaD/arsenite permease-like protein